MVYQVTLRKAIKMMCMFAMLAMLSACATKGAPTTPINDPLESANRAIFAFNDKIDRYALRPVASGYKKITPQLVRTGVNNFFGNLGDVSTCLLYTSPSPRDRQKSRRPSSA